MKLAAIWSLLLTLSVGFAFIAALALMKAWNFAAMFLPLPHTGMLGAFFMYVALVGVFTLAVALNLSRD